MKTHKARRRPVTALAIQAQVDRHTPALRKRIANVLTRLRDGTSLEELEAAVQVSVTAVMQAIPFDSIGQWIEDEGVPKILRNIFEVSGRLNGKILNQQLGLVRKIDGEEAVFVGGSAGYGSFSEAGSAISFDILNPRSVQAIQQARFELIKNITFESKEAIREVTLEAFQEGGNPLAQARKIKNSIGLTRSQSKWVNNFAREVETLANTTDPRVLSALRRKIQNRQLVTGRLSQKINALFDDPSRFGAGELNELVEDYHKRMVAMRARTIARTETARMSAKGQSSLWDQARAEGLISNKARRVWVVTPDELLRETHALIPTLNPGGVGLDDYFDTPFGPVFSSPAEPNCRCVVVLNPTGK